VSVVAVAGAEVVAAPEAGAAAPAAGKPAGKAAPAKKK